MDELIQRAREIAVRGHLHEQDELFERAREASRGLRDEREELLRRARETRGA